ncbi:Holliday junction resolvase-like protein [Pyrobaculum neutrophilum]|uniref:Secreted endonuclease-like protein n=1 Tax=Pyrobaculum neutrophilum (strain DSM 2338 / JCM 9278 / NBRC 100436 / V24Sta) TaxID=444157 RepID=B1YDT6_PYRNV|nr:Holliday junction resolvase-like protein [Pyrobaculum neutrophilum]ACB39949.1 secreted endonuclease-like protein [Pyrobaculum neutrophilum V24Sta]
MVEVVLLAALLALSLTAAWLWRSVQALRRALSAAEGRAKALELELAKLQSSVQAAAAEAARRMYEEWRASDLRQLQAQYEAQLEAAKKQMEEQYRQQLELEVKRREEEIRRDAVERSASTILGRVGEQLAPLYLFERYGIEPKDLRFIGSPVDYVAFRGLSRGQVEEVVFIEVKTGKTAALNDAERQVRRAVEAKRVRFEVLHLREEPPYRIDVT